MKTCIVTTTINVPKLIEDYIIDAKKYGSEVRFFITGDKKTPKAAYEFVEEMKKKYSANIEFQNPDEQEQFLTKFPELAKFIPWNCIQRRNLAILRAYMEGYDIIATIDDDNFLADNDYLGAHQVIGKTQKMKVFSNNTKWLNICRYLEDKQNRNFYPRGYSLSNRFIDTKDEIEEKNIRVVVNAGLWLGDPDIDAITRLATPLDVIKYKLDYNFALEKNIWTPFNSQNTAFHRDIVPSYFLCPNIGRYDDIIASYVVKRISDHLNDYIAFGKPLVKQTRNEHCLWTDLEMERVGLQITDNFCDMLSSVKLTGKNYFDCIIELIDGLKEKLDDNNYNFNYEQRAYINQIIDGYRVWIKTMKKVM